MSLFRKEREPVSPVAGHFRASGPRYEPAPPFTRQSRGMEQLFYNLRDMVGLSVLDLAGANQENINFLTSLGHKIYSQDIMRSLDEAFGPDPAEQTNSARIEYFLSTNFDYLP